MSNLLFIQKLAFILESVIVTHTINYYRLFSILLSYTYVGTENGYVNLKYFEYFF